MVSIENDCIENHRVEDLAPGVRQRWLDAVRHAPPGLDSPYLHPRFTELVAGVRDDVRVAVFRSAGRVTGVLPFQRARGGKGVPVGGRLSDFHGLVRFEDVDVTPEALLSGCGLSSLWFHHAVVAPPFDVDYVDVGDSPYMDLSEGYEAYASARRADSSRFKSAQRKARKLEREAGTLTFEPHTDAAEVFDRLLEWKSAQYARTGLTDVFRFPWTVELLRSILAERDPSFRGVLSVLRAGDEILAIHYGMQSHGVLHSWFPAYNPEFEKYSPGLVLFLKLAESSSELGLARIDLGRGTEGYKQALGSGAIPVAAGCLDRSSTRRFLRRGWEAAREALRSSPLRPAARFVRPVREWMEFR